MHLPPAAALRHFEQQRRPQPRLLPEGGRGGGLGGRVGGGRYRISPANGTVPKGFGSPVNIPHSIPLPQLQAYAEPSRPGKPTGYRTTAPNSQTHSQAPDTCTGRFCNLQSRGAHCMCMCSEGSRETQRPHPHNLQMVPKVAICNPFLSSRLI